MELSDSQIFFALIFAFTPGFWALRLATELSK
ncbi:MAG: photosystem I reaction center subunit XII [Cyanobacteria bacterium P01_F01_bin.53]